MPYNAMIIIGNGFDINCGLHTKYIDYYNFQKEKNPFFKSFINKLKKDNGIFEENFKSIPINSTITFFDIYFSVQDYIYERLDTSKTWADIEEMMLRGIKQKRPKYDLMYVLCFKAYDSLIEKTLNYTGDFKNYIPIAFYLKKIFQGKKISETDFYNYLKTELQKFSIYFSKYVNQEVNSNPNYQSQAEQLLKKICQWPLNQTQIFSFNYTRPIESDLFINIHGQAAKENIIFGVSCGKEDEKAVMHSSVFYPLTKEFKLAMTSASGMTLSTTYNYVNDIYFYGSSLGEQDYDFFDTLFENYGFFNNKYKAKLHFRFSFYEGKTEEEIRSEISTQVTKLINSLGDNHKIYNLFRSLFQTGYLSIYPIGE